MSVQERTELEDRQRLEQTKTIGIKYCGGCNPEIRRSELIQSLKRLLADDWSLDSGEPSEPWDVAILVCGCPTACLDRPEIRTLARTCVLVSGSNVDHYTVPVEHLAATIAEKLRGLLS